MTVLARFEAVVAIDYICSYKYMINCICACVRACVPGMSAHSAGMALLGNQDYNFSCSTVLSRVSRDVRISYI